MLGYNSGEYALTRRSPIIGVGTPDLREGAPLVLVEARATETIEDLIAKDGRTLLSPYEVDEKTTITSVARLLSQLFVADDGQEFALVLAGRWLLVAERARSAEGRSLAVNLQLVCDRNETKSGGEIDRALTCVSAESLAPDAEGDIWWHGVLEDHQAHRRRVAGPARGRTAVDRDHRQRSGPPPARPRARPATARASAAPRPAGAAVPVPDPLPTLRRGLPELEVLPVARRSTTRATGSTGSVS